MSGNLVDLTVGVYRYWRMVANTPMVAQDAVGRYRANLYRQLDKLEHEDRVSIFEAAYAMRAKEIEK